MQFLYPAFLLGALAIAVPVVLHLMRRDVAPEVPFSAVRLLRASPIERSRRRRLRDRLLLAARVAALALLALAFARPFLPAAAAASSGIRIVAIDRSFSMGAPGRFDRARELAGQAVSEAAINEQVAVLAFDDRPDLVAAPGAAADAHAALKKLAPGFGGTRYAPVLDRAVEIADGHPATLVVVSDLQASGWAQESSVTAPASLRVEVRDAGTGAGNVDVSGIRVETDRVIASVNNHGGHAFSGTVRVSVDGNEAASSSIAVRPGDSVDVPVSYRAPRRGALAVSVDDRSGYPADNVRFHALDPGVAARVLILGAPGTQSGMYLARALEAAGTGVFEPRVMSGSDASAMTRDEAKQYAAVVLLSTRGLDRRGREMLKQVLNAGGGLLVAAGSDVEGAVLASALGWTEFAGVQGKDVSSLTLAASGVRHPIFQPFGSLAANLGQVRFDRVWRLDADGWEAVAPFTDGSPALIERTEGKGRAIVFASDLDRRWNEFPLHPAFVPFAVETIRYIMGSRASGRDFVVSEAPAGTGPAPGVYELEDGRTVALNVDPRESVPERLTAKEFAGMFHTSGTDGAAAAAERRAARLASTVEGQQNLWRYGLVLMLAALVAESIIGGRISRLL